MKRKLDHGPEVRPFPSGKKPYKGPEYSRYRLRFFYVSTMRHIFFFKTETAFQSNPLVAAAAPSCLLFPHLPHIY